MPVKSEKQRRFMYASLAGKTDVPPSVAKKFVGPDAHKADGGAVKESEMKSKKMMFGAANKAQEQRGSAMKKASMKKYAMGGAAAASDAAQRAQRMNDQRQAAAGAVRNARPGGQVAPNTPVSPNTGAVPPEQVNGLLQGVADLRRGNTPPAPTPPRPTMPPARPGPMPPSIPAPPGMKKGGAAKGYAKGGSTRADGCATKGHTKGKMR